MYFYEIKTRHGDRILNLFHVEQVNFDDKNLIINFYFTQTNYSVSLIQEEYDKKKKQLILLLSSLSREK